MTNLTPPKPPLNPPGPPPQGAGGPPPLPPVPPGEGRSVSFFVAIFLAFLLVISAGLNILLVVGWWFGSGSTLPTTLQEADEQGWQVLTVDGDPSAADVVLRVPINGAIAEQGSVLLGAAGGTVSQVRRSLAVASRREDVRAVLLDINSPGGGVTDSDEIWRMLVNFKKDMKDSGREMLMVAHFGDISASGGYYIAAACDRIVARPTTITGSIGVIMSSYQISGGLEKLGVEPVVIKSERTPYKDILSMDRAMTDEERAILTGIVDEMLDRFIHVVDQGRPGLSRDQVLGVATGAIFSANQALDNGLVDAVQGGDEVLAWIRDELDVDRVAVVEQRRRPGLGDLLFGANSSVRPSSSLASEVGMLESLAQRLFESARPRFLYYWSGQ